MPNLLDINQLNFICGVKNKEDKEICGANFEWDYTGYEIRSDTQVAILATN